MPRCCFTKHFVESLKAQERMRKVIHYYDDEVNGFMLESRGAGRGTWYFRYRDATGRWKHYRIGPLEGISLTEARTKACTLLDLVRDGVDIQKDAHLLHDTMTLELFALEQYLPHARVKKRSWELDRRILRLHILSRLGRHKLDKVRQADIISWQKEMREKGLAPATCNRAFVLLKTLFNCAIRWGALKTHNNPCQGVTLFEDKTLRERYLSPEEARRLLEALHHQRNRPGALAIQLLLFTGARTREILSARWEYVDIERRLLTVPLSRSGKARHIPLSDYALQVLERVPRTESPWVFPQKNGEKPTRSIFYLWSQLRVELDMRDVRLHDLRHSFASFLINAGCSLYEVQRCLGHYDPKVTMRYAHLTSQALVNAANMVGKSVWAGAEKI